MRSGGVAVPFSIADLFASSEAGAWYGPSDLSTLFQDSAGTTLVTTAGQPVGLMLDNSGNDNHAAQATAAARPTYQTGPARATIDGVDDRLSVTVPVGGFTGTMVLGTDQGTASYGVNIPAGPYDIGGRGGLYFPGTALVGQLIRDGALSEGEAAATEAYFVENGATAGYGSVTDFGSFWRGWSEITSFPLINTSAGTSFSVAWSNCSSLTSFPLINTSSGTNFSYAWRNCASLTSFPLINTSAGTNFSFAWRNCSSLTSFPLINTSAGTNFSYAWIGCKSLTSFPLIETSSGTNFSYAWSDCYSLTSFPLINTSAGTNFKLAWYRCASITSFPPIDTSSGTDFARAWQNCSSLASFPANAFNNVKGGDFTDAFTNTALTQTSIDNILVSLVTSGIAAGTRVFDQSGGSAPSATGEAAIDTLRSRGWTVTVTGGYSSADVFTPADVFGATDIGLFNRIHPDNLFTDTNGTINATVGDAVAYIEDLSGNENHRIQATAAKRPTLQQDPNGAYKLVYDGVDDFIDVTYSGVISTPISTVSVVRKAPNRRVLNETTDTRSSVLLIEIAGDETLTFYAQPLGAPNPSAVGISIPSEIEILILGTVWAQENSLYRINGVQNTGLFNPGSNTETTGYRPAANNANPPVAHSVLEEYGAIQIDRELTTEQFEKIEDYFQLEVGITQ